MSERKPKDEISRLLDSFQEEDVLEEKMEGFTAQKRRKDRIEQLRRQQEIHHEIETEKPQSTNDTVVLRPESSSNVQGGQTVMFDPEQIEEEDTDTNKTVVINDNEIQSLIDEDKPPKLRREVVSGQGRPKMQKKTTSSKRGLQPAAIAGIVVAVLIVVGLLGFVIYTVVSNMPSMDKTTEKKEEDSTYEQIKDWLDGITDGDYSSIEDFESKYNELTDKQKKKLNEYFESVTGQTFDELLAKAKSDTKKESSNNNAKIAELRGQLDSLKSQLSSAQSELNSANSALSSAQSEYNSWNEKLSTWQDTNSTLQQKTSELETLEARMYELQNIPADQITQEELTELTNSYSKQESLENEISNLQGQLSGIGDHDSIQSKVDSASSSVSDAQSKVDSAQSKIDDLTSQIQSVENQISALQ